MYNKEISRTHSINGYTCFCDSAHPLAHKSNGRVYMHRHIASLNIGRWVTTEEIVHHKDEDRANNEPSNLEVMTLAEHSSHHSNTREETICPECYSVYTPTHLDQKVCSKECASSSRIKNKELTKEVLDELIPSMSWVALGKLFGYTDNGIRKRAKVLGCDISNGKFKHK